jgi:uncharacterized repeat protein (TIGR04076 family)
MAKCRITVLRTMLNQDIIDQYTEPELNLGVCSRLKEGQKFIVEHPLAQPEGFCDWAWTDIKRDVTVVAFGGNFPWLKNEGTMITSCTDGLRPVVFLLERIA